MLSINNFKIIKKLGSGSSGIVYLVEYKDKKISTKKLALKVIKNTRHNVIKSIDNEINPLINLSSIPNCSKYISCYYDNWYDKELDSYYILQEYIPGSNLEEIINKMIDETHKYDTDSLWGLFITLTEAIEYLHSRGFAHRDIKPGNIMYDTNEHQFKFVDFGLSCSKKIKCKYYEGTPSYTAPEIHIENNINLSLPVAQATDIYSLGATFYQVMSHKYLLETWTFEKEKYLSIHSNKILFDGADSHTHTADSINFIIDWMINYNWYDRPSSNMLLRYLKDDSNGCSFNGVKYYRPFLLKELNRLQVEHDKNDYLSDLCHLYYKASNL